MSYEKDMYIDENILDVELLEQPSLVAKYSQLLAEAIRDRDLAKEALEQVQAEINLDIRDNPTKYKLEKVTDNSVGAAILMEKDFQDARAVVNDTNYKVNVLTGIMKALDHRKSAIENLVKLCLSDYFSGPALPHNLTEVREDHRNKLEHRIGQSLKRTTPKSTT